MHNPFAGYGDITQKKEEELAAKQIKKLSARQEQYNRDNELWETNRMLTSGIAQRKAVDLDFEDDLEVFYCFYHCPSSCSRTLIIHKLIFMFCSQGFIY